MTISAEKDNSKNEAVVTISYGGQGIDAELLPKLFSKFVSKLEQGTGLGLFIAKSILNAHGGDIWAFNNETGGAPFKLTLPLS